MKLVVTRTEKPLIETGDLVIPKYLKDEKYSHEHYRIVISTNNGYKHKLINLSGEVFTNDISIEQINIDYELIAKNNQLELRVINDKDL